MDFQCTAKKTDRTRCEKPATHYWGSEINEAQRTYFCCEHFSLLVREIFDLDEAVDISRAERRHTELVKLYENKTQRLSRLLDKMCSTIDLPKYKK